MPQTVTVYARATCAHARWQKNSHNGNRLYRRIQLVALWVVSVAWGVALGVQELELRFELCEQLCEQLREQRPEQRRLPRGRLRGCRSLGL